MKLCFCIVHSRDRSRLADALVQESFKFTVLTSTGGFLSEGNATFMVGIEDNELDQLRHLISENCHAREQVVNIAPIEPSGGLFGGGAVKVPVGGAVLFCLPVDYYEHF